jgi:NAD(P)-dependent dehydrogenase (short-subunit alcohol dehydrogenase family)
MPAALVTGASRGIGREVALELSREGYTVLLGVRDPGSAPSLAGSRVEQIDVSSLWACRLPPSGPTGGVFRDGAPISE